MCELQRPFAMAGILFTVVRYDSRLSLWVVYTRTNGLFGRCSPFSYSYTHLFCSALFCSVLCAYVYVCPATLSLLYASYSISIVVCLATPGAGMFLRTILEDTSCPLALTSRGRHLALARTHFTCRYGTVRCGMVFGHVLTID